MRTLHPAIPAATGLRPGSRPPPPAPEASRTRYTRRLSAARPAAHRRLYISGPEECWDFQRDAATPLGQQRPRFQRQSRIPRSPWQQQGAGWPSDS